MDSTGSGTRVRRSPRPDSRFGFRPSGHPAEHEPFHLSSPAVAERLQRLEQAQVILGYHARIDPKALGFALSAVIRVRPAPRQLHEVSRVAQATPEVVDCRRITGEDCYTMTAHVRSVEHLEEVIDRFAAHGQTTTSIVQSSPVPSRGLDFPNGVDAGS